MFYFRSFRVLVMNDFLLLEEEKKDLLIFQRSSHPCSSLDKNRMYLAKSAILPFFTGKLPKERRVSTLIGEFIRQY